ncbi:hypothetical protein [Hyphomicrobium sp. D-2]|uniref:hypothetical protein n=1 Tax=Hyphomicrobium sp. D-2 TaxID=3041621 RepID=UPI0024571CFA|nr:hypothetical protein [Hyphomicrobium sp. D-2]MDH4983165.1 hypothetical protein [Hyphomicrobium sp. D-2]
MFRRRMMDVPGGVLLRVNKGMALPQHERGLRRRDKREQENRTHEFAENGAWSLQKATTIRVQMRRREGAGLPQRTCSAPQACDRMNAKKA